MREKGYGIRVNAIAPGSTLSEENPTEEVIRLRQQRLEDRALARVQVPADLVASVVFFASPASDFAVEPFATWRSALRATLSRPSSGSTLQLA